MKHRIFIAINLPKEVKKRLTYIQERYLDFPIKWTRKENLHITLVFLGEIIDEDLIEICNKISEAVLKNKTFSIDLNKVVYGPPKKLPPKMIWVTGEQNISLGKLQKDLEESLLGYSQEENRGYAPHITLGKINAWRWKQIEPEERPNIEEDLNLNFDVTSIEIMESRLRTGGPEYEVLESYQLEE
ncbi:MAG: RNA 2',3'-cyclic phosphodiesterase [Candidatus Nealsonbacteria bacterium]